MKRYALAALLILTACAVSIEDKIAVSCQTYASSLATLSMEKAAGNLSAEQITAVDDVRTVVNPVCLDGEWTSAESALASVETGIIRLTTIERNL